MAPQDITVTQEETFTGGLCLGAIAPVSNSILLEQPATARDHDTWGASMEHALAPLKGNVIQSTSDEAPGLLAYVEHPLGVHHSPDLFHVQHERGKAVAAPMAAKQRAAARALMTAAEQLNRVQEQPQSVDAPPQRRGPGRPPKAAPSLEQAQQAGEAARQEPQRLMQSREHVGQCIRAIGQLDHFVDLDRGIRRNGKLIASDIHEHIDTSRPIAPQEGLSKPCLDHIDKAERVVPKMQATIEFVSSYVRHQVHQLGLAQPASYAMPAPLIPSYSLERVATTQTVVEGQSLRALANRLRTPLFALGGAVSA
jgi:hypothetical protein